MPPLNPNSTRAQLFPKNSKPTPKRTGATRPQKPVERSSPGGDVQSSGPDYGAAKAHNYIVSTYAHAPGLHRAMPAARLYQQTVAKNPDLAALPAQEAVPLATARAGSHRIGLLGKLTSPALKTLSYVGRPGRGVEGAISAGLAGKDPIQAAEQGLLHGKGPTGSDILQQLGVHNKILKAVGGFGLDVATDPVTYATAGLGGAAERTAASEAARISAKALEVGMPEETAARLGQRAARRVLEARPNNRGVQLGVRAKLPLVGRRVEAKTSGRASATVSRTLGIPKAAAALRNPETRVGNVVDTLGRGLVHDYRPAGLSAGQHATIRAALAEHRASTRTGEQAAQRGAQALQRATSHLAVPERNRIIDLIESGRAHEDPVASQLSRELNLNTRQLAQRGLVKPFRSQGPQDARAYFPHIRTGDLEKNVEGRVKAPTVGSTRVKVMPGRGIRKSLGVLRTESTMPFSEDLTKVYAAHMTKGARAKSISDLWQKVASTGKELRPGRTADVDFGRGELVYKVTPHGLSPLVKEGGDRIDLKAIQNVLDGKATGRYVVLNKNVVEDVKGRLAHVAEGDRGPLRFFDKGTGKWKTAVTVLNPSYHGRNLIGDLQNAWLGGMETKTLGTSGKALRALEARNVAQASAERFTGAGAKTARAQAKLSAPVSLGKAGKTTIGDLISEAEKAGAIRTGFVGAEVTQLAGQKGEPGFILRRLGKTHRPSVIRSANEYREDFPRLASYITARKRGLTPAQAAAHVAKHHFDYADLTPFERQHLRRIVPFYTFFARNTRLQLTKLLSEPGKYAMVSHALDEAAKAAGFVDYYDYAQRLPDQQQRGIPVPIRVHGKVYNAYTGTPMTDLNQTSVSAADQVKNLMNRITPLKVIPEIYFNYSLFFEGQIQNPNAPKVPAPTIVGSLPGFMKRKLGVAKILDKRTGKMIWGWNAKADYLARQLPQTNLGVGLSTATAGSRGQTPLLALVSQSGVRVAPAKLQDVAINTLQQQRINIEAQLGELRQENKNKANSPRYRQLLAQHKQLVRQIQQAKTRRGDKVISGVKPSSGDLGGGLSQQEIDQLVGSGGAPVLSDQEIQQLAGSP